jgi:hypothetical protein
MRSFRVAANIPAGELQLPITLTAQEVARIRPRETPRRYTALFLRGYVQILPLDFIEALREKYPSLHVVDAGGRTLDRADDLDTLDGDSLRGVAEALEVKTAGLNFTEMRYLIRDARNGRYREREAQVR